MPSNNTSKYIEIGRRIRELPQEEPVSSYEWEELVQKLCESSDTVLHEIGVKERDNLQKKRSTHGRM
jgi:hypothetical protein